MSLRSRSFTEVTRAHDVMRASQRPLLPSRLGTQLSNGVSLELECSTQNPTLLTAMINALRSW